MLQAKLKQVDMKKNTLIIIILFGFVFSSYIVSAVDPIVTNPNPYDKRDRISIYRENLTVDISDDSGSFDWTIETGPDIGSDGAFGDMNGTKTCDISGLGYNTTYTWYVNVTNGIDSVNEVFSFITKPSYAFDMDEYESNVPGWHIKGFERYLGAFVMPIIFAMFIGFVYMSSTDLTSTVYMIFITFALYGTTNAFIQAEEYSLFFAIIAIIGIAGIILSLFLKKRR